MNRPSFSPPDTDHPDLAASLGTRQTEADDAGLGRLAAAYRRLGLLLEVADVLAESSAADAAEITAYCADAADRLAVPGPVDDPDGLATEVVMASGERWGAYLELIDPSESVSAAAPAEDHPVADAEEEDEPLAMDSGMLLRLLTGAPPAKPAAAPAPAPVKAVAKPAAPPAPVKVVAKADSSPAPAPVKAVAKPVVPPAPVRAVVETPPAPPVAPPTDTFRLLGLNREAAPSVTPADFGGEDSANDELGPLNVTIDPELRDTFLAEGADLFERIENLVLALEQPDGQSEHMHELGRCFHTLKGAAGSVDLQRLAAVIHETEGTIEAENGAVTDAVVDRLHRTLRYVERVFQALTAGGGAAPLDTPSPEPSAPFLSASAPPSPPDDWYAIPSAPPPPAASLAPAPPAAALPGEGPLRVSAERIDELMDIASELITRRGVWAAQGEAMKEFSTLARSCRSRIVGTIDRIRDAKAHPASPTSTAVGLGRRDDVTELTRRLAEQADDLIVLFETAQAQAKPLSDNAESLARLTLHLWEALQAIRIVPVRGLFQRLTRVAHEAARVEGRHVEVVTVGEDTGLDRAVQDKAFEPLLHVVRNAVSHGIESAEERARAGKPRAGRVSLQAARTGHTITLSVADDGRGIDYQAVADKGRRLGLLGPDERPGVDRLNALIFQAGFSTRNQANAIAGRGVGMDVVSQEAARLHGTVTLASKKGEGAKVSLSFPARLALEQAMVLRVGDRAFALPVELAELAEGFEPEAVDWSGPCPTVSLRETRVPLVALREVLGLGEAGRPAPSPRVLLTRIEGEPIGVLVDAIDGTKELVIKPLGPLLAGHPLVSGTSHSVTGEVILALSPAGLARWFREGFGQGGILASLVRAPKLAPVLVVDDSISVRKVVVRLLRSQGYEVVEASDGLEALGKIRNNVFSLVVSDLEMPRMDGFELLAELSRLEIAASVPVIIASSKSDPETRRRVLALGAREFVPKPINPDAMAELVRSHATRPPADEACAVGASA